MSVSLVRSMLSGQERFAITGASGWLGRTALELLAAALGPERFSNQVVGFAGASKTVMLRDGTQVRLQPLEQLGDLVPGPTHLLHFAYLTRDRVAEIGVADYVQANLTITATIADAIQRFRPLGVFTTSSGAVYGSDGRFVTDVAANPYGALKYIEELAVRRAAADAGTRSVVTRIFSLAGAYMTKPELYALGDFVLQALAGGPIRIRSRIPVERSYCAAGDVVTLAMACLLNGGAGDDVIFDSGGEVVEIGQLTEHVRTAIGRSGIALERDWDPSAVPDRYVGEGASMSVLAARHGLVLLPLDDQIRETADYLRGQGFCATKTNAL